MFKKLNNKGDTLAIVLIGMFVLSILGTLILGVTATNFNMKVNDKKAESTFYYAEKAIDEVYSGIGREVMNAIQSEYTDVLTNYYSNETTIASYDATTDFKEKIRVQLANLYSDNFINTTGGDGVAKLNKRILGVDISNTSPQDSDITNKYIKNITGGVFDDNKFYLSDVANYEFTIFSPTSSATEINYYKKTIDDPAAGTFHYEGVVAGDVIKDVVERIEIKNFGIRCDSTSNGYSSSIVTDFIIDIPNISIDLSDSGVGGDNLEELAKYSLIAQGHHLINDYMGTNRGTATNPAVSIANSSSVTINGNVYADGTVYDAILEPAASGYPLYYRNNYGVANILHKNPSVLVGKDSTLNINSKVLACINDFNVQRGANVDIGNRDDTDTIDGLNSLQFYANNIKTVSSDSSNNTVLNIKGNCIVKDDLQLDGDYNRITLSGNYFGYGYRGTIDLSAGTFTESNSSAITGFTNINDFAANNKEHESSSAIVVNGKNTELDMSGLRKTILMGRAYIDLEGIGTSDGNGYYMTGESISFKGNQHMYLAKSELDGSKVAGLNPIELSQLEGIAGKTTGITYSDLGISGGVVAKRMGSDVYFYVLNNNPVAQTNYFVNAYGDGEKRQNMLDKLEELEVNRVTIGGRVYSVGNLMIVNTLSNGRKSIGALTHGENYITEQQAVEIVDVIDSRFNNLKTTLQDDSNMHVLGSGDNTKENITATTTADTPYDYYINRKELFKFLDTKTNQRYTVRIIESNGDIKSLSGAGTPNSSEIALANEIKSILSANGFSTTNKSVGYWISNEGGISPSVVDIDIGIVISERPVAVNKDFVGLILTNGEVTVSGNISISACEDLTKLLLRSYPDLNNLLTDEVKNSGSIGLEETGMIASADSLKYTDIVKKDNWKRDYD